MTGTATQETTALLARARAGDAAARDALVRAHLDDVFAVALRILRDRDLAADAAQDAFVSALAALDGFRGESSFRTWLLRITANAARSVGRRTTRRREVALDAAQATPAAEPDPARGAVVATETERIEAALAELPEKQRLCVALRIQQDLPYAEVARVVGCSEGSARVNYHHGIRRLREMLG